MLGGYISGRIHGAVRATWAQVIGKLSFRCALKTSLCRNEYKNTCTFTGPNSRICRHNMCRVLRASSRFAHAVFSASFVSRVNSDGELLGTSY
jgi:hypothetical protein